MTTVVHTMRQGDLLPRLNFTLYDENGQPVDLTTATQVLFTMRLQRATAAVISRRACAYVAAPGGQGHYDWQAGDTDGAGTYDAEVEVTYAAGGPQSFPNGSYFRVVVTPKLV